MRHRFGAGLVVTVLLFAGSAVPKAFAQDSQTPEPPSVSSSAATDSSGAEPAAQERAFWSGNSFVRSLLLSTIRV